MIARRPSVLTGVDPDDHGIYDFLEMKPGTHKQYPVTVKLAQCALAHRRPHGRRQAPARYALLATGGPTSTHMEFLSTSTAIALAPPST